MPGRSLASGDYRFGFNGKEMDDEVKGTGNSLDFGARIYDPRVGRWLSRDPRASKFPNMSPYMSFNDNPLLFIDPDGETGVTYITVIHRDGRVSTYVKVVNSSYVSKKVAVGNPLYHDYSYKYDYYDYVRTVVVEEQRDGRRVKTWDHQYETRHTHRSSFKWQGDLHGWIKSRQKYTTQPSGIYLVTLGVGGSNMTLAEDRGVQQIESDLLLATIGAAGKTAGGTHYEKNGVFMDFAKKGTDGSLSPEDMHNFAKAVETLVNYAAEIKAVLADMKKEQKEKEYNVYTPDSTMNWLLDESKSAGIPVDSFPAGDGNISIRTPDETLGTRPGSNN